MGCCLGCCRDCCRKSSDLEIYLCECPSQPERFVEDKIEIDSEAVEEGLVELKSAMDEQNEAVEEFVSVYKCWDESRRNACKDVREIADRIDKHHKKVTKAKIAGGAVGTVASVVATAGAIAAPFTLGGALLVSLPAGAVAGAALATSSGAMIVDKVIQSKLRDEALEHLERDKEMTERMAKCLQKVQEASEEIKNAVQGIAETVKDISGRIGFRSMPALDELEKMKPFLSTLANFAASASLSFSKKLQTIVKNWGIVVKGWKLVKTVLGLPTLGITLRHGIIAVVFAASCVFQVITLITALVDIHKGSLTDVATSLRSYVENLERDRAELKVLMNAHCSHLL